MGMDIRLSVWIKAAPYRYQPSERSPESTFELQQQQQHHQKVQQKTETTTAAKKTVKTGHNKCQCRLTYENGNLILVYEAKVRGEIKWIQLKRLIVVNRNKITENGHENRVGLTISSRWTSLWSRINRGLHGQSMTGITILIHISNLWSEDY